MLAVLEDQLKSGPELTRIEHLSDLHYPDADPPCHFCSNQSSLSIHDSNRLKIVSGGICPLLTLLTGQTEWNTRRALFLSFFVCRCIPSDRIDPFIGLATLWRLLQDGSGVVMAVVIPLILRTSTCRRPTFRKT